MTCTPNSKHLSEILLIVSCHTGISEEDIKGKYRKGDIVQARQIYCYLSAKYTTNTLNDIGEFISGRDHTTVIWSIKALKALVETDYKDTRQILNLCEENVREIYKEVNRTGYRFMQLGRSSSNC